jgi:hypothetical protein
MLSDDDLEALLRPEERLRRVTMLHPLTVQFDASEVVMLLEAALANDAATEDGANSRFGDSAERGRCLEMLAWARGLRGMVPICIYPSDDDGLDELDSLAPESDPDGTDIPF